MQGDTAAMLLPLLLPFLVLSDENATDDFLRITMPDDVDEEMLIEELEMSGIDVTNCLETGCTINMLYNGACDEDCNNLECEYDLGFCYKFFDYHGYGWDFEVRCVAQIHKQPIRTLSCHWTSSIPLIPFDNRHRCSATGACCLSCSPAACRLLPSLPPSPRH